MPRDSHIPLFLWIATAIVVHLVWGGGADRVADELRETGEIRDFAETIRSRAAVDLGVTELALWSLSNDDELSLLASPIHTTDDEDQEESEGESEREKEKEQEKEQETVPALEQIVAPLPPEKKAELAPEIEEEREVLPASPRQRIAVKQHVTDDQQQDNPDAEFIADEANRVEEQTQARITATDQNAPDPTPGKNFSGPDSNPGSSAEQVLGQSEQREGETSAPVAAASRVAVAAAAASAAASQTPAQSRQEAIEARVAVKTDPGAQAMPEWITGADSSAVSRAQMERQAREAKRGRVGQLPQPGKRQRQDLLGLGAEGTTENGVRLNLTHAQALAAVGREQLAIERKKDADRRLAEHRGSFKAMGIERWRASIENYVPSVKPGNQTALNTARVPFASYLNTIHNQVHPVFAGTFLSSLDRLSGDHPMNRQDMSTNLEIVLNREDGRLVRMGVTKTSGVTPFDLGALESVFSAQPFGPPPKEIVSPDGNVYLHWEFYRNPYYACSTYFARPFMLKVQPKSAPPKEPSSPPFLPGPLPEQDRHGWRKQPAHDHSSHALHGLGMAE